jgi:Fur family ferric uptake transcriptional regulator
MCSRCDYRQLLEAACLEPTDNRMQILEIIGNNHFPLSASDIYDTIDRTRPLNRVTVYRILDLLVENSIIDRISTGGRASYYGLAPNEFHRPHPHFYCTSCGQMDCLNPETVTIEIQNFARTFPGRIDKLEMRLDGVCKNCLKNG